jgi:PAS domain S-box-containing protein
MLQRPDARPIQAELLQTLSDLAHAATEAHTPDHLATLVVQCARQILGADGAALFLWDEPTIRLRLACSSDATGAVEPLMGAEESLAGRVFAEQQPLLIGDYAAVPLSTPKRAIGALVVQVRAEAQNPAVLEALSLLGVIASTPLETVELRAHLYEEEKLDGALRRMTQALAAHETEGRVLWLAVRYAAQLLKAPFARVWLLKEDGSFVCAAAEGDLEPDPIGMRLPPDCLASQVVSSGPINLADAATHPGWYPSPFADQSALRAYVSAPMRRAGRSLGVLTVMRQAAFKRDAEHLVTTLANASAAAVDNARALARADDLARNLAQAQQRYRLLFEHSPVGVLELDSSGRITAANPSWEKLSGQRSESVVGQTFESLTENAGPRMSAITRETRLVNVRGDSVAVRSTRVPLTVDDKVIGAYELVEDLADRGLVEKVLRGGVRRRGAMADIAAWALAGGDLDELLQASVDALTVALDAEFGTLYELEPTGDRLILRAAAGGTHEFEGQVTVAAGASSQAGYTMLQGEPVLVEDLPSERRFVPDRRLLSSQVSSSLSVAISGLNQVYGVIGVHSRRRAAFSESSAAFARAFATVMGLAITYRRSDEALYQRRQQASALVEHLPDVVLRVDPDLKFTFASAPVEWATGKAATTFVGLGLDALGIPDTMLDLVQLRFKHVFRTGRAQAFDLTLIGPDGPHEYETYLIPELARDGLVAAVLAVARDVTERRRIEAEHAEQQRQLLAHEQRLEELLAHMIATQAQEQRRRAEAAKMEPLSAREKQVLSLLAQGRTNSEIALELLVSPGTVKNHISRILPKLGAIDRTQAAARAVQLGLLTM